MGICWGDPRFPTPSEKACQKSKRTLITSSTTSSGSTKTSATHEPILEGSSMTVFTFAQLKAATQDFRNCTILGVVAFGLVYKGLIDDKGTSGSTVSEVAVKKLSQQSLPGFPEFHREIVFLSMLSHPNIVKLLGYCYENSQQLLVYEFPSKGSLDSHLYGGESIAHPLPWDKRLKIAVGAARGLAFLHTRERKIIKGDVMPTIIWLDESYNAKLSDFVSARFGPSEGSYLSTSDEGESRGHGYTAPEVGDGHLYIMSDVYGFGVVLLELLMGRPVIDWDLSGQEQNLVTWSQQVLPCSDNLAAMMDPKLKGIYSIQGATKVALLALKCVCARPLQRPSMTAVVEVLEEIEAAYSEGSN